jgi:hypothetical protein
MFYRLEFNPDKKERRWNFIYQYSYESPTKNSGGWVTITSREPDGGKLFNFTRFIDSLDHTPSPEEIRKLWNNYQVT